MSRVLLAVVLLSAPTLSHAMGKFFWGGQMKNSYGSYIECQDDMLRINGGMVPRDHVLDACEAYAITPVEKCEVLRTSEWKYEEELSCPAGLEDDEVFVIKEGKKMKSCDYIACAN